MKSVFFWLLITAVVVAGVSCGGESETSNDRLERAFAEGRSGVWLSGHGIVVRELGTKGAEQRVQVRVSDDLSVVVLRDTGAASRISMAAGDRLDFHGLYDFHGGGGTVSRTHPDPAQSGGGGWIKVNGVRQD